MFIKSSNNIVEVKGEYFELKAILALRAHKHIRRKMKGMLELQNLGQHGCKMFNE